MDDYKEESREENENQCVESSDFSDGKKHMRIFINLCFIRGFKSMNISPKYLVLFYESMNFQP